MASILLQDKEVGPFFLGDQLPDLFLTLVWDSGGPVDLTSFPTAAFTVKRLHGQNTVMGGSVTDGAITYGDAANGAVNVRWPAAFTEPGTYRFRLTLGSGDTPVRHQTVQRLIFRVTEDE